MNPSPTGPLATAPRADTVSRGIARTASYFAGPRASLLGHLHTSPAVAPSDVVAVICNPLGFEFMHGYRSIRHLADRLAASGTATLRFDYDGTGDSPGSDLDAERVRHWLESVACAARFARHATGRTRLCLIGVRFGATLAALSVEATQCELAVLWNPCVAGRRYVREMEAVALTAGIHSQPSGGELDCGGFVLTAETRADMAKLNLLDQRFVGIREVLIAGRDDMANDESLERHLDALGVTKEQVALPGYADMMAEPQFAVVPDAALERIVGWLDQRASHGTSGPIAPFETVDHCAFEYASNADEHAVLEETLCRFGEGERLFGVVTRPVGGSGSLPAVVLPNAGAAHHVGSNRFYVALAYELAARGYTTLRFDLEGLGDSVLQGAGRENHPYPEAALADMAAAFELLARRFESTSYVAAGLCSGAHSSFHAGAEFTGTPIRAVVLINPLTFRFVEGMSLATSRHMIDVQYYKRSVRNVEKWKKLARLQVDWRKILRVFGSHASKSLEHEWQVFREWLDPRLASDTAKDLERVFALGRSVGLFVSSGDPGYEILLRHARRTALLAVRDGRIQVEIVADADHTFSTYRARVDSIGRICAFISQLDASSGEALASPLTDEAH